MAPIPFLPPDGAPHGHRIHVSTRPHALLAANSEELLQRYLSNQSVLTELDAARLALREASNRPELPILDAKGRGWRARLYAWPVLVQPSLPFESFTRLVLPDPAGLASSLSACWLATLPVTAPDDKGLVPRWNHLPVMLDAEAAYDGSPLEVHRTLNKLVRTFTGQARVVSGLFDGTRLNHTLRSARRPLVLLTPALLLWPWQATAPVLRPAPAACARMGALASSQFASGGQPLRQVLAHAPLPWHEAVDVARAMQLSTAVAFGLASGHSVCLMPMPRGQGTYPAPWEDVQLQLGFNASVDGDPQADEFEPWTYCAWWQPSDHLMPCKPAGLDDWVSASTEMPIAATGHRYSH